jgi:hypothetical protein
LLECGAKFTQPHGTPLSDISHGPPDRQPPPTHSVDGGMLCESIPSKSITRGPD